MPKYTRCIVHGGRAHRDELLALGLAVHAGLIDENAMVERRDPSVDELDNPNVLVLDVGGRHEPEKGNFDHHQFAKGVLDCALSLLAKATTHRSGLTYHALLEDAPWYGATILWDVSGPFVVAKEFGLGEKIPEGLFSPVEAGLLDSLDTMRIVPWRQLQFAHIVVMELVRKAEDFRDAIECIRRSAEIAEVKGLPVIIYNGFPLGLATFRKEKAPTAAISISRDERDGGWCLYRFDDHGRVDMNRVKGMPMVGFVHNGGFMAKVDKAATVAQLLELAAVATSLPT